MSLLAGLSQQGDSISAHNADAAAHGMSASGLAILTGTPAQGWAALSPAATFSNADYSFAVGVAVAQQIGVMSAPRVVTLPLATAFPRGVPVVVADLSLTVSALNHLRIDCAGSDTIGGGTSVYLSIPGDVVKFYSDGISKWSTQPAFPSVRPKTGSTVYPIIPGVEIQTQVASSSFAGGNIYYCNPWTVSAPMMLSGIIYEIATGGGSGKTFRWGLYLCDSDMQPGALVYDSGALDGNTVGVATHSFSKLLLPGRYLSAVLPEAVMAFRTFKGGSRDLGLSSTLGASPWVQLHRVAHTYGALSNPGTPWTMVTATSVAGGQSVAAALISSL